MPSPSAQGPRKTVPPWLLPAIGYGISMACLVWLYWGFDWKTELARFAAADRRWVTLAVIADISVYWIQGWRWRLLLKPVTRVPYLRSVQAVFIGLFANEVLPFRSGELIRCYVLGKWGGIPFSVALSSAVIERLFDGIWLVFGFCLVAPFVPLPGYLRDGAIFVGAVLLAVAIMMGIVMFRKQHAHKAVSASRWPAALWHVVEGLHAMGSSPSFYGTAAISLVYLAMQAVPIYALMVGYGLDLPFSSALVVLVILRLGTLIPQAPGNVGGFQFFTVVALRLFEIDRATATGFATLMFVVVTLPLWLGGFIAVAITGMRVKDLQRYAQSSLRPATAHSPDPPPRH